MTLSPELLMPAGSIDKLKYAYAYGADAAYVGVPLFSLRARENEFSLETLKEGITLARQMNKKIYLTANIFARNLKLKSFRTQLQNWAHLKPDAFIMSDPGLIMMAREIAPEIPIHLSVQANCMNWQGVKFWQQQGIERIILSRELRIEEIKEIKDRVPDIELEAFVHGSICIAYSGRCLLSHYMSYRDANQGVCDNSCRYGYKVHKAEAPVDEEIYLEDLRDQGKFYRIDEDEHGTYIMNSKDLCVIEHLKELKDAGVCSFKVEGRTKSVHYVALISKIYRQAIDDVMAGKEFNTELLAELEKVANRGYHKGFAVGNNSHQDQCYTHSVSRNYSQKFAGLMLENDNEKKLIKIEARNKMTVGQEVEVIYPHGSAQGKIYRILNNDGIEVTSAHGGAGIYSVDLGLDYQPYGLVSLKESSVN